MVGFDNEDNSFVFELTFNYGIASYKRGNDLQCILLHRYDKDGVDVQERLLNKFKEYQSSYDGIYSFINEDFLFQFIDSKAVSK